MLTLPPTPQTEWGIWHALEFSLLGAGAGLGALVSVLALPVRLDVVAAGLVALGGLVLLGTLTRPLRAIGAVRNQAMTWISRGAAADFAFIALALVAGVFGLDDLSPAVPGVAIVVMLYPALAMRTLRSVPSWGGWSLPSLFACDAVASGAVLCALLADVDRGWVAGLAVASAVFRAVYAAALAQHDMALVRLRSFRTVFATSAAVLAAAGAVALNAVPIPSLVALALATGAGAFAVKAFVLRTGTKRGLRRARAPRNVHTGILSEERRV